MTRNSQEALSALEDLVQECPIIDNHAHNLYRHDLLKSEELIGITSEASEEALQDMPTTLAHLRAVRMLSELLSLPPDSEWKAILAKRAAVLDSESSTQAYLKKCFQGTETILLDDLYDDDENLQVYTWHNQFTRSPCTRIVRIESVASDILEAMYGKNELALGDAGVKDQNSGAAAWEIFLSRFDSVIQESMEDDKVVGFKSVICYQTGLNVSFSSNSESDALTSFRDEFLSVALENEFSLETKVLNDYLVIHTCNLIADCEKPKPLQFHTGLGSNNMSLLLSNPSYLQPLIAAYPTVPIILLHSSYPFTREAGYLASVYKNCYLDLGLVWPEISRRGQEDVLRQALELTPWAKLLWSTDGNFFPETYYLANMQGRLAMSKVMVESVQSGDLTLAQAEKLVRDVFFENSNRVYRLGLELKM